MTLQALLGLEPLLVLAAGSVLVMLLIAATRNHRATAQLTTLVLLTALGACVLAPTVQDITPLLTFDHTARTIQALVIGCGLAVTLLMFGYLEGLRKNREEMYLLLLLAVLGAGVLGGARHAASMLLGLETLSIALFGMIAYTAPLKHPLEAGIKYLVLSAASSAILLFGLALIYAVTGTLAFAASADALLAIAGGERQIAMLGLAMTVAGLGFKLSLAPFHLWTADVYEGAPAPVTALLATVSKAAVAAVLLRLLAAITPGPGLTTGLVVLALATIIAGNLLALLAPNVKRLLAYSSIAHFGYFLVPLIIGGPFAVEAALFYLVGYCVSTLGAFGVVSQLSSPFAGRDADRFEDYRGLFWRRPYLTSILTPMLLSLAGVPLTAGFIAKFYVLAAGVDARAWLLIAAVVLGSAVGLYYYLRLTIQMFQQPPGGPPQRESLISELTITGGIALGGLFVLVFWFGIWPQELLAWLHISGL